MSLHLQITKHTVTGLLEAAPTLNLNFGKDKRQNILSFCSLILLTVTFGGMPTTGRPGTATVRCLPVATDLLLAWLGTLCSIFHFYNSIYLNSLSNDVFHLITMQESMDCRFVELSFQVMLARLTQHFHIL